MALNVDTDLEPFSRINPCGFADLEVTDLRRLGVSDSMAAVADRLLPILLSRFRLVEQR